MRFPWQKGEIVERLPNKFNIGHMPWCWDARLVSIRGSGALRWEARGEGGDSWRTVRSCLTLRGTPLLSRDDPGCPTCESLLTTGWGLSEANAPELEAVRDTLNTGFTHLDDAIFALAPLLGLLETGLYVLADGDAYPADGGGRFFWDVPDERTAVSATARMYLADEDFEYEYPDSAPVFLYPSQRRSRFSPERAAFYMERFQQEGPPPRGIALYVAEGLSLLLDGHHKAAAAARLGRALPCLTILPAAYSYRMAAGRSPSLAAAWFGPFSVQTEDLQYLPKMPFCAVRGPQSVLPEGHLADREWPEMYRAAGASYPTAREYALVTAAEIGYPTDEELEHWLERFREYRPQLRAALVLLRSAGDPRLKETALRCAAIPDRWCSLKEEAFRVLAAMRGDPDAEAFFIQYFIDLELLPQDRPRGTDVLTEIAHSFWNGKEAYNGFHH